MNLFFIFLHSFSLFYFFHIFFKIPETQHDLSLRFLPINQLVLNMTKLYLENNLQTPPPEELSFLGIIIIFCCFSDGSQVSCSGGGRWDGWQEARSDLLRKTQNRGSHRWEGIQRAVGERIFFSWIRKTEQLREPGRSCWWGGNLQVRTLDTSYSITFSSFWLLDVNHRSVISVDS